MRFSLNKFVFWSRGPIPERIKKALLYVVAEEGFKGVSFECDRLSPGQLISHPDWDDGLEEFFDIAILDTEGAFDVAPELYWQAVRDRDGVVQAWVACTEDCVVTVTRHGSVSIHDPYLHLTSAPGKCRVELKEVELGAGITEEDLRDRCTKGGAALLQFLLNARKST